MQELGKNFKTLGVGWAWEALRGVGHGTKTTFGAVSGIVGLQVAQQELQRQMQAGQLTQAQVGQGVVMCVEALLAVQAPALLLACISSPALTVPRLLLCARRRR